LLRILGKLNDGKDYSDDDIEAMGWQKKTSLVQKDPVKMKYPSSSLTISLTVDGLRTSLAVHVLPSDLQRLNTRLTMSVIFFICIFFSLKNIFGTNDDICSSIYRSQFPFDNIAVLNLYTSFLGLPTWFGSFSSADTKWIDLLRILGKLNDGKDYSDDDIEAMDWQKKTSLVQKDPVTCSRFFDHRVQQFIVLLFYMFSNVCVSAS
jgi:hypothetical protein